MVDFLVALQLVKQSCSELTSILRDCSHKSGRISSRSLRWANDIFFNPNLTRSMLRQKESGKNQYELASQRISSKRDVTARSHGRKSLGLLNEDVDLVIEDHSGAINTFYPREDDYDIQKLDKSTRDSSIATDNFMFENPSAHQMSREPSVAILNSHDMESGGFDGHLETSDMTYSMGFGLSSVISYSASTSGIHKTDSRDDIV